MALSAANFPAGGPLAPELAAVEAGNGVERRQFPVVPVGG